MTWKPVCQTLDCLAAILCCLLLVPQYALAQQYFGGVAGTITDPTGAVVPNVSVTVTNINKGTTTKVVSNESGIYRALNLTPDPYRVEAEASGFKRFAQSPILIEMNRVVTLDIGLEVGATTETISVTAAPPILETESGKSTATIEGKMVAKLPFNVNARADFRTYITQLPNSSTGETGRMQINGARTGEV